MPPALVPVNKKNTIFGLQTPNYNAAARLPKTLAPVASHTLQVYVLLPVIIHTVLSVFSWQAGGGDFAQAAKPYC